MTDYIYENQIYSPDNFQYNGVYYERDAYTNRYYRLEASRNTRLVKHRISYKAYQEVYRNCSDVAYDYVAEALNPELSAHLIGWENTEVAA